MDGGGFSFWTAISTWSTPTVFFCLLNVVVAIIFIQSTFKPNNNNNNNQEHEPVQFFRSPSLLGRVKSFNFSRTYPAEPFELTQHAQPEKEPVEHEEEEEEAEEEEAEEEEEEEEAEEEEEEEEDRHVARTVSDTVVESVVKRSVKMMKKSQSVKIVRVKEVEEEERKRPATVRERKGTVEDEAIDAKADDFINRFKQQLKLQRIDSLLRYRGGGGGGGGGPSN